MTLEYQITQATRSLRAIREDAPEVSLPKTTERLAETLAGVAALLAECGSRCPEGLEDLREELLSHHRFVSDAGALVSAWRMDLIDQLEFAPETYDPEAKPTANVIAINRGRLSIDA